ncbi:dihydroxyacetone kinase phosphoryl donor subunit DhaM [Herbiconiux sp. KACC 21604]|uniref:dihydroxyacetone kinase phosphoryl donor subunit DhaM n=1 Tax=unclassified Herbiconiux TaxID=2618217 RepID=UPI001491670F|nr:dihydroxyacetone kinase phosphoryl donor subunit DhaM [Herbiconiux sp. SALV-R1]QJU53419.1 PTS-dependent dihydroxyacetone kinase phosphotransferase subunit DhaM [Herbiconiux sp. SALV-R1]WPO88385.1 dihydroxyacetone kinase phosphoryl donor subunit DhaM [Herbiconiux sp. KACC 21604]
MAGTPGKVGVVYVSHSVKIAEGLVELAGQMAGSATLVAAGGTDEGGIGTSFDKVSSAIGAADSGHGVAVFCDLGSAILTAETALDFLDDEVRDRVRIVSAPLVEGGVAAAVAAESGDDLAAVVAAGESAAEASGEAKAEALGSAAGDVAAVPAFEAGSVAETAPPASGTPSRTVTIVNRDGLHARPAAEFVKLASSFDTKVTVNGRDAKSLLGIMSLGLTKGTTVEIASDDPAGTDAVNALADLVEGGFGEA